MTILGVILRRRVPPSLPAQKDGPQVWSFRYVGKTYGYGFRFPDSGSKQALDEMYFGMRLSIYEGKRALSK